MLLNYAGNRRLLDALHCINDFLTMEKGRGLSEMRVVLDKTGTVFWELMKHRNKLRHHAPHKNINIFLHFVDDAFADLFGF